MTNQASQVSGNVSVPRELLDRLFAFADVHWYGFDGDTELRAILANAAAPIKQPREIPVTGGEMEIYGYQCRKSGAEKFFLNDYPHYWQSIPLVRQVDAMAEIARLQAEVERLNSEVSYFTGTLKQVLKDKIEEREALQSDLTKARVSAYPKLMQDNVRLTMRNKLAENLIDTVIKTGVLAFQKHESLESDLCEFLAHQSAPAAKGDL